MEERIVQLLIDSFPRILIPGLTMTIPLTAISFCFAMVIAVAVAMIQFAQVKVLKDVARFYIWVVRGTPLLVQLFVVFYGLTDFNIILEPFVAAVIVFSLNEGAYAAEAERGALETVPAGQMEAGCCVGMSYLQTMRRIVLPQALRTAFPSLANSLISMLKDTSLVSVIALRDVTKQAQNIVTNTYTPYVPYISLAVIYLVIVIILTKLLGILERRLRASDRR